MTQPNDVFALLTAIVAGDAAIEDGVAKLRNEGIESIDSLLSTLRLGLRERERQGDQAVPLVHLQRGRTRTPPELVASIVQRVPKVPFLLKGSMYDPHDITRFNGQELHFIAAPTGDHMVVVDDRELIEDWWQLTYIERYRQGLPVTGATQLREFNPRTWFYEDMNLGGRLIYLDKDRGYYDLTEISLAWPFGDWNDRISSYFMMGTGVTVLHEHTKWRGQTFSDVLSYPPPDFRRLELNSFGWNDRASSLETW